MDFEQTPAPLWQNGAIMLIEIRERQRLLCLVVLLCCLGAPSMAQENLDKIRRKFDPFQGISWKDFQEIKQKFKDAPIAATEKNKIEDALIEPLEQGILDGLEETQQDNAKLDATKSINQSRRLLNRSEILSVDMAPYNGHLYVIRIESTSCERAPNCQIVIIETSTSGSQYLGCDGGWGVAVRHIPGKRYPILIFASHIRAGLSGLGVLRFVKSKYSSVCYGKVNGDDGSVFTFEKCDQ